MYIKSVKITTRNLRYWAVVILTLLVLMYPLTLDTVPALLDYPIHLSRAYIIDNYDNDTYIKEIYDIDWRPIPNLASDILFLPLLLMFEIDVAGRILIGMCIFLNVFGSIVLFRANFGYYGWWPLLSALPAYHGALSAGFLNYSIGISFLLLFLSITVFLENSSPPRRSIFISTFSIILLFCHAVVFVLYVILSLCHFLFSSEFSGHFSIKRIKEAIKIYFFSILVPLSIYFYYSFFEVISRDEHFIVGEWKLGSKIRGALMPVLSGEIVLDVIALILIVSTFSLLIFLGSLNFKHHMIIGVLGIYLIHLILPGHMIDAAFISDRLTIPALLVFIASTNPSFVEKKFSYSISIIAGFLLVYRCITIGDSWRESDKYYKNLVNVVQEIQPGSSVMISSPFTDIGGRGYVFWLNLLLSSPSWHFSLINIPTLHSLPALPLTRRSSFSQIHFVWADKQILSLTDSFEDLDYGDGGASTWKPEVVLSRRNNSSLTVSKYADRFDYILFVYVNHMNSELTDQVRALSPIYANDDIILLQNPASNSWRQNRR